MRRRIGARTIFVLEAVVVGSLVALSFAYAFIKSQEFSALLAWGLAGGIGIVAGEMVGVVLLHHLKESMAQGGGGPTWVIRCRTNS